MPVHCTDTTVHQCAWLPPSCGCLQQLHYHSHRISQLQLLQLLQLRLLQLFGRPVVWENANLLGLIWLRPSQSPPFTYTVQQPLLPLLLLLHSTL